MNLTIHTQSVQELVLKASELVHVQLKHGRDCPWPKETLEKFLTELQGHLNYVADQNRLSKGRIRRHAAEMAQRKVEVEKARAIKEQVNWSVVLGRTTDHHTEFYGLLQNWMVDRLQRAQWHNEQPIGKVSATYLQFRQLTALLALDCIQPFHQIGKLDGLTGTKVVRFNAPELYSDSGKGSKPGDIVLRWNWDGAGLNLQPRATIILHGQHSHPTLLIHPPAGETSPPRFRAFLDAPALIDWICHEPDNPFDSVQMGPIKRKNIHAKPSVPQPELGGAE